MSDIGATVRLAYPRALSTLVRVVGSLEEAEDLLQEAALRALAHWQEHGVPDHPAGWLVRTARNVAIDGYRRRALARDHNERGPPAPPAWDEPEELGLRDDMLRLIFTCCHSLLSPEARVALTLRAVAGLSVDEIARAFLVPPRTMEQRITRAKRFIRDQGIAYEVPSLVELPERLNSVLAVIHLIFNEGYMASSGGPPIRAHLCRIAIGQAHLLVRLFPGEPEVEGLLALQLLTHARSPARLEEDDLVPLDRQDRTRWDRRAVAEGLAILDSALRRGRPGTYQIQAAISAVHCRAPTYAETDWHEILQLYDALLALTPTPVVALNRAVAVSRVEGPGAGLDLVEELAAEPTLARGHALHAVRAGLFEELGRLEEAQAAYRTAAARTHNESEARYFRGKLEHLEKKMAPLVGKHDRGSSSS